MKTTVEESATIIGVVTVPGGRRVVKAVRHFVAELVGDDHRSIDELLLCLSELLTNAVLHTASGLGGHVTIAISEREKELQVDVTDDGGVQSIPRPLPEPTDEGGRGLRLVEDLADKWGVRTHAQGTTVWFTVTR